MKIGFIGLGRMGKAMVLHLLERGVDVVVFNRTREKMEELEKEWNTLSIKYQVSSIKYKQKKIPNTQYVIHNTVGRLTVSESVVGLIETLDPPRIIWLMVPEGEPVDEVIGRLIKKKEPARNATLRLHSVAGGQRTNNRQQKNEGLLERGDIIIDGGNSFYKDSVRRYEELKALGIHFLDVGTSGGLEGARNGACMMIGGEKEVYERLEPLLKAACVKDGYTYFGPTGAGHFVKMVHNGVEYGMLQAIGEGFEILEKGPYRLDFTKVARNWSHGSVVRGWLMELLERALKNDPKLDNISGIIGGGSTGQWTQTTAKELKVVSPVIDASMKARKKSLKNPTFSGKVVAALRREFGGHEIISQKSKV